MAFDSGEVDAALDGPQRLLQHFGYLVVFEPVEIKQKRVAEYFRKVMDSHLNVLDF